ncbi:MAG TPA: rod shape-determining protein MreD, partial [Candidatus Aminicenantes bacterium]|nr:rod shape-determining protein MreD [Candidatus Aminicenantes bacterium]
GFLAGYISRKIHVVPFFRNLVFIFILGILELAIWLALYSFIFSERPLVRNGLIFVQPAVTALLGSLSLCLQRRIQSRKN